MVLAGVAPYLLYFLRR